MPDREKVKKALERCLICDISVVATPEAQKAYLECEYTVGRYCGRKNVLRDALSLLENQEAKTGKWIEQEDYNLDTYYDCSVCGKSWSTVEGTPWENGMNFCPHCGARMESILCDNRTEGR